MGVPSRDDKRRDRNLTAKDRIKRITKKANDLRNSTKNRLTDLEWTTCIFALRYAMNRQTIASSMLPTECIVAYWDRWTDGQKKMIARDLASNVDIWKDEAFGDPSIDRPGWLKFWSACDIDKHEKIKTSDGKEYIIFRANGKIYPLEEYIKEPFKEVFIPEENILL